MTAPAGCEIEPSLHQLDSEFLASESVRGISSQNTALIHGPIHLLRSLRSNFSEH